MKTVALLTGRGNNTLVNKNVLDILGKPVIFYPAHAGKMSEEIDEHYCSSDDEKILNAAANEGYKKIIRPAELATPTSQHIDCIIHGLDFMRNHNYYPDICVVILANNVTIKPLWLDECIKIMKNDLSISAVVPVYEDNDHHPLRAKSVNSDGTLSMYEKGVTGAIPTNRQQLPSCYFLSHNFWILNVKNLLSGERGQPPWEFMGNKIIPYFIEESIDIHKEIDLIIARNWIKNNLMESDNSKF